MTLYIAAVIWAAGFSQVQVAPGLYAPLLHERYHAMPASEMVDTQAASPMDSTAQIKLTHYGTVWSPDSKGQLVMS